MKLILLWLIPFGYLLGWEADLGVGLRRDYLQWSIGMHPYEPDVLSDLQWQNIWSLNGFVSGSYTFYKNLSIHGFANGGVIFAGHVWDRDYWGNNRTEMFSESLSKSNTGSVFDVEISLTVPYPLFSGVITEIVGYGYHNLNLCMIEGWRNDFIEHRMKIPMPQLDSEYIAQFFGPFIGFNYRFPINTYLASFGYTFTAPQYKGEGRWNLRADFARPFIHKASKGFGHSFFVNLQTPVADNWNGGLAFIGRYFKVYNGADHVYNWEGRAIVHSVERLNEVRWFDLSLYAYVQYFFDSTPRRIGTRERMGRILNPKH